MSGTKGPKGRIFLVAPWSPLLLDRWVDVAYAVNWGIYSLWGLMATIHGIATITDQAGSLYNFVWSGGVGTLSFIALIASISLFFRVPRVSPMRKKQIEYGTVIALVAFIAVYPVLLTIGAAGGDGNRVAAATLAYSYLVFPALRIWILRSRIKAFERAAQEYAAHEHQ